MSATNKIIKYFFGIILVILLLIVAVDIITPEEWKFPWTVKSLEYDANSGDIDAAYKLYNHYALISGGEDKALHWLRVGSENDSGVMQFMYASILDTKNNNDAKYWYCRASRHNNAEAAYRYAEMFSSENYANNDVDILMQLYKFAAYKGHVESSLIVVDNIIENEGNAEGFAKALKWVQHLLVNVNADSQYAKLLQEKELSLLIQAKNNGYDSTQINELADKIILPIQNLPQMNCEKRT